MHQVPGGATRTILELTAEVMQESFRVLGEGVVLGTMPRYLERFGRRNAQFMAKHYGTGQGEQGTLSALEGLNVVSRVTGTPYDLPIATPHRTVKRLKDCEFLEAFGDTDEFARAMICKLHQAVYQGAVNAYGDGGETMRVHVQSRILFGDAHCDFLVEAPDDPRTLPVAEQLPESLPTEAAAVEETVHFYISILVAFIEYLGTVLPEDRLRILLTNCADTVGMKVQRLFKDQDVPVVTLLTSMLAQSGRTFATPNSNDEIVVASCPYARPIKGASKRHDPERRDALRNWSCGICTSIMEGAAERHAPGTTVERKTCLTMGDEDCRFHVQERT